MLPLLITLHISTKTMMTNFNMENLFFSAAEAENAAVIEQLLNALKEQDDCSSDAIESGIDFLMEAWGDSIEKSEIKSKFCLELALLDPNDSPLLRISLQRAFNCLKRAPFMKSAIVKATGVRDSDISIKEVAERFLVVENLQPGTIIFNPVSGRLGEVDQLDEITSEVDVKWDRANSTTRMTLLMALNDLLFFKDIPELPVTSGKQITVSAHEWSEQLKKSFIYAVDDNIIKQIAFSMVSEHGIVNDIFENWWSDNDESEQVSERHPSTARTLHELHTLLLEYDGDKFSQDEQEALNNTLVKLKRSFTPESNMLMLAESLALLRNYLSEESLTQIAEGIKDNVAFWPPSPDLQDANLVAWEKLPAKHLPVIAQLTSALFSEEYMASLLLQLSFRCWSGIVPAIDAAVLAESIENASFISADTILWVWKNRSKLSETTIAVISPQAIRKAVDSKKTTSAQDSVKQLLINNREFQEELIERIKGNEMDLLRAVQACDNLRMDEKQSLLVKCSAISTAVKHHIEKGEGKKMFAAAGRKHIEKQAETVADVTSFRSFAQMNENLNDIVNKQIPENSAAIAHARSYGDLKENAEYKAAKERQAFLQRRREEIERSIMNTQPIDFSMHQVDETVVPGSVVTVLYQDDKTEETFSLLGVWDSDPESNFIAYTSALGKTLNGKHLNEEVTLPDKRKAVIVKVEPLSIELIDQLNDDQLS